MAQDEEVHSSPGEDDRFLRLLAYLTRLVAAAVPLALMILATMKSGLCP